MGDDSMHVDDHDREQLLTSSNLQQRQQQYEQQRHVTRFSGSKSTVLTVLVRLFVGVSLAVVAVLSVAAWFQWKQINILTVLDILSAIKVVATLFKYIPQVLLNHRRRSTDGWSIGNILLDTVGGVLSLVQLVLDAYLAGKFIIIAKVCSVNTVLL
jgi:hypothetical protein